MAQTQPLSQFTGNGQVGGNISRNQQGVSLTSVNPNELTSYQLGQLMRSGNPLVQQATQSATNLAAARGAGLSGAQYGDVATRAAFASMTPIAQADAGQYADVRNRNQDALNQQLIEQMGNSAQLGAAGIAASASRYASDNNLRAQMAGLKQNQTQFEQRHGWDVEDQTRRRGWDVEDQQTSQRNFQRNMVLQNTLNTIFSDPAYWSNPNAAMNMARTFQQGFDNIWDGMDGRQAFRGRP